MAAKFLTIEIISQLIVINERCGRAPAANTWRHEAAVPTTKRSTYRRCRCTHGLRHTIELDIENESSLESEFYS